MSELKLELEDNTANDNLTNQESSEFDFNAKLEEAKVLCELIQKEYKTFDEETGKELHSQLQLIDEKIESLKQDHNNHLIDIENEIDVANTSHLNLVNDINKNKEDEINQATFKFNVNIEKLNNLLSENDKLYRKKIDELNSYRDTMEETINHERIILRSKTDEELHPLKIKAEDEIKKIELTINQTREDNSLALASLKRKFDLEVRQIYKKNAQINDNYNAQVALLKKEYNEEISKIDEKEELRRQELLIQIDALKIQFEDEKSKLINQRVEAIAQGRKKEAKELKAKTVSLEKFYHSNIESQQKDADVDFKAIEEQRSIAKTNLERKLKQLKFEQQINLENNAHALRVLQYKYECDVQKKNLNKEIIENELAERIFKQENANKLEFYGVSVQSDIKDRQLVYELTMTTLDYNKANNENYIDYQCFKINQEHQQTKLQLLHDLELKKLQLRYKKDLLSINRQHEINILNLNEKLNIAKIDHHLKLIHFEKEKIELMFLASKKIKQKVIESKLERIKTSYTPYLVKLENEFLKLQEQYLKYMDAEKLEHQEMVRQINKMHDKEIAYLNDKIKLVDNGIKSQFENMILLSKNRHKTLLDEMNKNHNRIINAYESKLNEAKNKLEQDKNRYLESMIYPVINDMVNYGYQLIEGEYNGALTNYKLLLDTLKGKAESEKIELQKQNQFQINSLNSEYNKNIEQLENEFKIFKMQNDNRIKEEESIKENRLNEIEKNRQSALSDYQIAKNNAQRQYENDIAELEAKLSNMEQEIERLNNSKTQSMIKENSEICRMIDNVEENYKKQIAFSKSILDKNLKNIKV